MTTTKTIKELSKEVLDNFELKCRANGDKFYSFKNSKLLWMFDLCYDAHPYKILPNDYVYEAIHSSLGIIFDADGDTAKEINDKVYSLGTIKREMDATNLLSWVSSNLAFLHYCNQAIKNGPYSNFTSIIMEANYLFKCEVFNRVLLSLDKKAKESLE